MRVRGAEGISYHPTIKLQAPSYISVAELQKRDGSSAIGTVISMTDIIMTKGHTLPPGQYTSWRDVRSVFATQKMVLKEFDRASRDFNENPSMRQSSQGQCLLYVAQQLDRERSIRFVSAQRFSPSPYELVLNQALDRIIGSAQLDALKFEPKIRRFSIPFTGGVDPTLPIWV